MAESARFVQFPHPGGEHGGDASGTRWPHGNTAHLRKFMLVNGAYRQTLDGPSRAGELTFWGEWEGDSSARELGDGPPGGPDWLHDPLRGQPPADADPPQNTDPFVFGDRFLYTFCRQGSSPALRELAIGSVLLFGSYRDGGFCLDTCFVVANRIPHTSSSYRAALANSVPPEFFATTLDPMYGWARHDPAMNEMTFALYLGATVSEPIDGMFSFVPCLPVSGEPRGFVRPRLDNAEVISPKLAMAVRLNRNLQSDRIRPLWQWTAESVLKEGLALGTSVAMPQLKRD
jgi:hypothetical protein